MQIHITRGEDSSGPFTLEQVRDYLTEGILLPDDLAWHEGLENWIPLSQLVAPPVAPQPVAAIPAVPEPTQTVEPVAAAPMTAPAKSSNKKLLVVGIIVGVLVLGGAATALFFFQPKDPQVAKNPDLPGENNPTPLSPDPSTLIPGLPGVDTNAVPTNAVPTKTEPTTLEPSTDADSARILEQAIRKTLRKAEGEALTPDDFAKVKTVTIYALRGGSKIKDLIYLRRCPNLESIYLQGHAIADISALADLPKLKKINLSQNKITNLAALSKLPALTEIWLQQNGLEDLQPLASIKSLERLHLDSNPIEDLSPLAGLSKLETLGLSSSKIIDLTPLGGLANLKKLQITDTPVHNYKALKALTSLGEISFSPQADTDFGAVLGGMGKLKSISISKTKLPDLTGLVAALPNPEALETINIFNCDVQNIEALAECKNLRSIHMMANRINDLSALKGMNVLTALILSNNKISDIKPLAEVPNLSTLWLSGNFGLTDVSPLMRQKKLRTVLVRACRVPEAQLEELRQAIPRCSVNGKAAKK